MLIKVEIRITIVEFSCAIWSDILTVIIPGFKKKKIQLYCDRHVNDIVLLQLPNLIVLTVLNLNYVFAFLTN